MQIDGELEHRLLKLIQAEDYRPLKPRAIAKKLDLLDAERDIKKILKRLVKDGQLAWGPQHLVLKVETKKPSDHVIGTYRRAAAGYGFVTPDQSTATDRSDDVYIPRQKTLDAADGDRVKIRTSRRRQGDEIRLSGQVIEVVQRRTNRFVGTYHENDRRGVVIVEGGIFDEPILVGDAAARNCRIGDVVVIEMANFPSPNQAGEAVIVEVLGDRGKPGVDTLMIIREFGLPEEFPESAVQAARDQAEAFDESIAKRTDFTGKTVITIDPKTARDFDDAVSLEKTENGHWLLGVHIADVSHFVPARSALDDEAYQRGTSIYLPDRVIPMLPELISNNLASLQPDRIRYCVTAMMEFDSRGVPIATELHRGAIRSAHRFNYEEIDDYLANDRPWKKKLKPKVFALVRDMHSLAMTLRKRRMDRGAIELSLPDVKIELDDHGKVIGAQTEENTESHQIIEEFMLAANEAVAQSMVDRGLHLLRRIHEPPAPTKLKELTKFVRQIGIDCESLESRFEIKRVAELANRMPEKQAIHFSILRSMQKAVYSPRDIGHYALGSDAYCHFTSPIRRYPDLVIHRMIGDIIDGKKPDSNFDRLAALGNHCSRLEQRAEVAERELKKMKLLSYFADRIGTEMQAVITGVEPFGLFAQGVEIPAEGLITVENLPDDHYQFDRSARTLNGYHSGNQYRLGDLIVVRVARVDINRRQLEFQLTGSGKSRSRGKDRPQPSLGVDNKRTINKQTGGKQIGERQTGERQTGVRQTDGKRVGGGKPANSQRAGHTPANANRGATKRSANKRQDEGSRKGSKGSKSSRKRK